MRLLTNLFLILAAAASVSAAVLPGNARIVGSGGSYDIFVSATDGGSDDDCECPVSLWIRSRHDGMATRLLTTAPQSGIDFEDYAFGQNDGKVMPPAAVSCIEQVWVHPYDENIMVIQGCPDGRNLYTFVFNKSTGVVIHLPGNSNFHGFTAEDGDVLLESYAYYDMDDNGDGGGRYSVVEAYDYDSGRLVGKMSLKHHK